MSIAAFARARLCVNAESIHSCNVITLWAEAVKNADNNRREKMYRFIDWGLVLLFLWEWFVKFPIGYWQNKHHHQ